VNAASLGRSLTLRLALLYAASTLLVLLAVGWYMLRVIDRHFIEQDITEMQGKLELAANIVAKARQGGAEALSRQLDDALVGHHHLALAIDVDGERIYAYGHAALPAALAQQAASRLPAGAPVEWMADGEHYRGLALRLDVPRAVVMVAVDTAHHREFIDNFRLALGVVLIAAVALALLLGLAAARLGLAPLRQTAQLAREISAERLDRRIPAERVPPELDELATSFNAMLDRLRDAIERLSAFAADLAHEMRTPVSNLMMQTQVMLAQARSAEDYREVLASNLEEYERLARTIGDMLFLAKADNGLIVPTREAVDLAAEVAELFEFYEALAEDRGVRLAASGTATASGDRLMLRRALANLISNAIRYAPRGGDVRVELALAGGRARIDIENPCAPLPADKLERLFDRFYRADPARRDTGEGAGLGLAITRSIVRAHGGEITVSPTETGLRFGIELPVV
jgi:two-component system heavy metal sensor histidine kinase CusS